MIIRSILPVVALVISPLVAAENTLVQKFDSMVTSTLENAREIPGLNAEQFQGLRPGILEQWKTLVTNGRLEISGTDKEVRPYFVSLQGVMEHVLSHALVDGEVKDLVGTILTPMPPTPLCTASPITPGLVDPSIEEDPSRLFTVQARTVILRKYLQNGGNIIAVYPRGGLSKRSPEQQAIYAQERQNYPETLREIVLSSDTVPEELIGATYTFADKEGNSYAFGIKMTQANSPTDNGNFALWFGAADHPDVKERIEAVNRFIKGNT